MLIATLWPITGFFVMSTSLVCRSCFTTMPSLTSMFGNKKRSPRQCPAPPPRCPPSPCVSCCRPPPPPPPPCCRHPCEPDPCPLCQAVPRPRTRPRPSYTRAPQYQPRVAPPPPPPEYEPQEPRRVCFKQTAQEYSSKCCSCKICVLFAMTLGAIYYLCRCRVL
ncbi:hypothetical protein JYU34_004790 [Plutella xylostella]|uniref:Uncharacterized protein n=1 Tax=Plutella xylostella TaxID=51655 RepID=A0ABQ7QYW5_PLUXY|nr:hypothetical protein JYU34_004790 [Plutella xylostella]